MCPLLLDNFSSCNFLDEILAKNVKKNFSAKVEFYKIGTSGTEVWTRTGGRTGQAPAGASCPHRSSPATRGQCYDHSGHRLKKKLLNILKRGKWGHRLSIWKR
jgi:hypothetical protein